MKTLVLFVTMMLLAGCLFADSFSDNLQQLAEDSAKDYVRPLVTSFGSNLNSGLYNTAQVLKPSVLRPIRFGFDFHTMVAMVPDSDKEFNFELLLETKIPGTDSVVTRTFSGKSATVFGGKGFQDPDLSHARLPNGLDLSVVPLIVPQFRFGLPAGNELMVRYLPPLDMGKFGSLDFWGVGLKHSIDQYIPLFPVHLAVQGAYQSFTVGDFISINSLALNAHVSKRLLMLTLYGGIGWEDTRLEADYVYKYTGYNEMGQEIEREQEIKFDIKGENNVRMTAGFRWALIPFIHINADYTISAYQVITLGFGAQF